MTGICCTCQQEVPIYTSYIPRNEERERGLEDFEIDMQYGPSIDYLCESHHPWGELCEGTGQIPQFVLKK